MMNIQTLLEIKNETTRFTNKLNDAYKRLKEDNDLSYGSKETAALKRAAMDLKNELTKITK